MGKGDIWATKCWASMGNLPEMSQTKSKEGCSCLSRKGSGCPARLHLGSSWWLICRVPTASHPHPWLVPYYDGTDTRDFCLLVVCPISLDTGCVHLDSLLWLE